MKLYDLPRGSRFTVCDYFRVPPGAPPVDSQTVYRLGNIDGMYSYCTDPDNNVVHVGAGAEVVRIFDNCEVCKGQRNGVPGNETVIDGKVVCDYCHADGSYKVAP